MTSRRSVSLALAALAVVLAASACGIRFGVYRHTTTVDTRVNKPVKLVDLKSSDGDVKIHSGGGDGISVHRTVHYRSGTPKPGQRVEAGVLTFTKGCSHCRVDYDITVPASMRLKVDNDSGRIEVSGVATADIDNDSGSVTVHDVTGDVRVHDDSGSIDVRSVTGDVRVSTESGSIEARSITGDLQAHSSSGAITAHAIDGALRTEMSSGELRGTDLRSRTVNATNTSGSMKLSFATAPESVTATTSSGSLTLTLPGGPYAVDTDTGSGDRDINVPTDPTATAHLKLTTSSGSLTVDPADRP